MPKAEDVSAATDEAERSQARFKMMAMHEEMMGNPMMANMMKGMADDEDKHIKMMQSMMSGGMMGGTASEEIKLGGHMMKIPLGHQFPQAYGDWVDLAENIKEKSPNDPVMITDVNYYLQHIARGTEKADEAKRWLMQKAGELGIK